MAQLNTLDLVVESVELRLFSVFRCGGLGMLNGEQRNDLSSRV